MHDAHAFLIFSAIYLLAAVLFVPLANRLGLGSVIGYLIAGAVVGPFGLGLIREVETIYAFSEFGVVLMLFVIGLELDPDRLWGMRRQVFFGGALQMAICGVCLAVAARAAGVPVPAAWIAGPALALSSTAMAVQTMTERGLLASPAGRAAFGILLFQDLAAIPLIAVVPLLATAPGVATGSPWLGAAKVAAAAVLVVGAGRYAIGPALRMIARTHLRDVFTAVALLVVIAVALLMDAAGASMALGAFLAGVVLASSEYRHELETDIEPFRGLLLGLFFVSVGMSIDFALLESRPVLVAALMLGFVALKTVLLFLLSWPIGVPAGRRPVFAAVLSQGSEFAFVVVGAAEMAHVLPAEWGKLLTLVVALSLVMTPLLVGGADWLEGRLGAVAREEDRVESEGDEVIIVGFGRFGQIIGRLLFASGIRATVLDQDPDNIEILRRLGFRVFYGDGTRLDLLAAAGAERARVLVNAIDDMDGNLKLVDLVREHFPGLRLVVRVRDVTHWRELRERGLLAIERETFESALRVGRHALEALGVRPYEARERADAFRRHNLQTMESLLSGWGDETQRLSLARTARLEFERQFQQDVHQLEEQIGHSWRRADVE